MASNQLKSLNEIFQSKIFRIPDYQRGYSWDKKNLEEFWNDLVNLAPEKTHYTGVLTIGAVDESVYNNWGDDKWLIKDKGYFPFYVIDGQQRITTAIILIQSMIESLKPNEVLLHDTPEAYRKKFILETRGDILKSFIFGYEKDNPSYEYLKTKIFLENSNSNHDVETLYTANLIFAKEFFHLAIQSQCADIAKKEEVFKKLTQYLKFNIYEVENEIDVFVAFETMNNRGKPLSKLELLKNRLIYISTKTKDPDEAKIKLRKSINDALKTVYEYLGKNKSNPLDDDDFLKAHWIMYFAFAKDESNQFSKFLLEKYFTVGNVTEDKVTSIDIQRYIDSLQSSVKVWFEMHNAQISNLSEKVKPWLVKIYRQGFGAFAPLTMAVLQKEADEIKITDFLKEVERYQFVVFDFSQRKSGTGTNEFSRMASDYYKGLNGKSVTDVITSIKDKADSLYNLEWFKAYIFDRFHEEYGYYGWSGSLHYVLYEYETYLMEKSKDQNVRIDWTSFIKSQSDKVTIEHIYPQNPDAKSKWVSEFSAFTDDERGILLNSIGNLLALSKSKNSSLQNYDFEIKTKDYQSGSHSENKVSNSKTWGAKEIVKRGKDLLEFIEKRWRIDLSDSKNDLLLYKSSKSISDKIQ